MFPNCLEQGSQWESYRAKILNDELIKVGEAQESLQILYSAGRGPLSDGGYFSWMHGNSIWANDAAKEGDGASVVCIVLSYNEQLILGEMLEDLVNTVYIGFM